LPTPVSTGEELTVDVAHVAQVLKLAVYIEADTPQDLWNRVVAAVEELGRRAGDEFGHVTIERMGGSAYNVVVEARPPVVEGVELPERELVG
jgi:hypothetical protein